MTPRALLGRADFGWKFLLDLPKNWTWLSEPFGEREDFHVALTCYYMALHLYQLADTISTGNIEKVIVQHNFFLGIPVCFLPMPEHIIRNSYRLFINNSEQVKRIWRDLGVDDETIKNLWGEWLVQSVRILGGGYPVFRPQRNLFIDLEI